MTNEFVHYRQLERRLWMVRWSNEGRESPEEDATLDEMEEIWLHLSDEEQDELRREPPRCWPTEPATEIGSSRNGPWVSSAASAPAPGSATCTI